jgi:hypothetical protein
VLAFFLEITLCVHADGFLCLKCVLFLHLARGLVSLGAELHEGLGFNVETRHVAVDDCFPDYAEGGLGTEVVLVVEAVNHFHDVLDGETGVFDVRHLVAGIVFHLLVGDVAVLLGKLVKLGAGKGVGD